MSGEMITGVDKIREALNYAIFGNVKDMTNLDVPREILRNFLTPRGFSDPLEAVFSKTSAQPSIPIGKVNELANKLFASLKGTDFNDIGKAYVAAELELLEGIAEFSHAPGRGKFTFSPQSLTKIAESSAHNIAEAVACGEASIGELLATHTPTLQKLGIEKA